MENGFRSSYENRLSFLMKVNLGLLMLPRTFIDLSFDYIFIIYAVKKNYWKFTLSGVHSMMLPNGAGYGGHHGYGQQTFPLPPPNAPPAGPQAPNPQAIISQLSPRYFWSSYKLWLETGFIWTRTNREDLKRTFNSSKAIWFFSKKWCIYYE